MKKIKIIVAAIMFLLYIIDMNEIIQVPAELVRVSTIAGDCLSIGFHTQEIKKIEDRVIIFSYYNSTGWLCFKMNEFKEEELPTTDVPDKRKTPSQRLRSVLFKVFKTLYPEKPDSEFDPFYIAEMERIISHFKGKL